MSTVALDYPAPAAARRFAPAAVLPYLVLITLGLWLGGLVTLILFVSTMFVKARAIAVDAAPVLFDVFEKYQLALAAVALLTLVAWRLIGRSTTKIIPLTISLAAVLLATGLATLQIGFITPRIERYRIIDRAAFDKFHHLASTNYTTISVLVLIGLVLAIAAVRREMSSSLASERIGTL